MSKVLILRTCLADGSSPSIKANGFQWPKSNWVEALDWNPDPKIQCGQGLYGALWGEGNGYLFCWNANARWLVVEVDEKDIVPSLGKVRFRGGIVVHCGNQKSATNYIAEHGGQGRAISRAIIGYTAIAEDYGTATAGDYGTVTAGDYGTATAGNGGTATVGDNGILNIKYWDSNRYRIATGYVGENGIKPNVAYQLDIEHEFVEK